MEKYELKDNIKELDILTSQVIKYDKLVDEFIDELDTQASNDDSIYNVYYELGQTRERMRIKLLKLRLSIFKLPEGMLKTWEMEE